MKQAETTNLALFIDFDNVALGARDARQRFDIHLVLQRLLEKGKIIVKRAYADWSHHKEYLTDLHQAGIELIEIPAPGLSGKNSADIRLVVDAMDLCYGKEHLDTFIIVSGDSDFSPLVSKLRENGKAVIGVGVRNSSSHLLIVNCDEFIFYDDIYADRVSRQVDGLAELPADKRKLFGFLIETIQGLMRETKGVLHASLVKDTMKRKQPEFNEHKHGYSTFSDLLEEAMQQGLLEAQRDSRAGGAWVVVSLGKAIPRGDGTRRGAGRSSRRRNGRGRRGENGGTFEAHAAEAGGGRAEAAPENAEPHAPPAVAATAGAEGPPVDAPAGAPETGGSRRSRGRRRGRRKEGGAGEVASNGTAPADDGAPRGAAGGESAGRPAAGPSRPAIVAFPAQDTAAPAPAASGDAGGAERGEDGRGGEGAPAAAGKGQERAKPRRRPARKPAAEAAAADEAASGRKRPARGRPTASRPAARAPRAAGDDDGAAARKPARRRRSPAGGRKEED